MNRLGLYMVLLVSACDAERVCSECSTDAGLTNGASADGGSLSEQAGQGGDRDPCADVEAESLDWEAQSEVGSPAELFDAAERSCEAELSWSGASFDDRAIEPLAGRTTVTVELMLDHDSARWTELRVRGGVAAPCGGYLEVDGNVTLQTEDGTFSAQRDVTLRHYQYSTTFTYGFEQPLEDHEGSLSIELHDGQRGSLSYALDRSGTACAGEIRLNVTTSGTDMSFGSSGRLAHWSDSGCPLGEAPFDLTEPGPEGITLTEAIEDAWGVGAYAGTWSDGQQAELALQVEVPVDVACRELDADGAVIVPVRATYSTSDGRLRERTADASVRATVGDDGSVRQLDFWLSDDQICADESDSLPYEPADCAAVERVTVQLGFNLYDGGDPVVSGAGLDVYFEPRGGGEPPAGDRLQL